ncbi:ankyrin repeat domain-containing protein SOWAHB [Microcebus murinus]|uniref:ankyrin repeat domain-containing protein SOWAHB n=1 Tax=Microcebus murinus TaxID=30608 RepID=UPI003F6C7322
MARELSQEALLDFLLQAGGRATNAALLSHFGSFLRDPDAPPGLRLRRRELFKGLVNAVAAVRQDPDGTKCVVLRRRYRDLLAADGPPRGARRAWQEEAPAGAAGRAAGAARNALPAGGTREAAGEGGGPRGSPGRRALVSAAAQAGAKCAAAETQGRCCWECLQNSLEGLPGALGAPPDPAAAGEKPARALPAQKDSGATRQRWEDSARSPPAAIEAAGSRPSPPAPLPRPAPPGPRPEMRTPPGPLHCPTLQQQQQQRTREWVARHLQTPEAQDPCLTRAWTVLPDNFLQRPTGPRSEPPAPPPSSHPLFPVAAEPSEPRPGCAPPTVFRSIRCQLSLQDLEDLVGQESGGRRPEESPGGPDEPRAALGTAGGGKLGHPTWGLAAPLAERSPSWTCPSPRSRGGGRACRQVPPEASGCASRAPEPLPRAAPRRRRTLRRSPPAGRGDAPSSDEERLDEGLLQRGRGPPRSRKPSKAGTRPSPRLDAALTPKPAALKAVGAPGGQGPAASVAHRPPAHKPSLVPLDAREHQWIVKLASGSWVQALTLFWEDPQLVLHKDFLTGYTALHWVAKHGDVRALQDLVSGARKAGVALDVNARSGCGYTPLHLAAIHGHQAVIKLLVQRLASRVSVRDGSGKRPWQYLTRDTSAEIWQLLGAPRGKPMFPVRPLVQSSPPTRKAERREVSRNVTRKTSFAALLKSQHDRWKLAGQYEKFPSAREREEYSD